MFFDGQTVESIIAAVEKFETSNGTFRPGPIRENAERFRVDIFRQRFREFVDSVLAVH